MKIIYMGTPEFAVTPLEAIYNAGHEIALVVTQPDKPNSRRGNKIIYSPVKQKALEFNLDVIQPLKVSDEETFEIIKSINADMIVVCAFGQLLKKNVLSASKYGCFNIHASLLPKYRGAAPLNRVLIEGETQSGITIMAMDEGLDTGDMILKKSIHIDENMNIGALHDKMSVIGAKAIVEAIELVEHGKEKREKQNDAQSTYANKISKEECHLKFDEPVTKIHNRIRGLSPFPGAFALLDGKIVKILDSRVIKREGENVNVGEVVGYNKKDGILIAAKEGILAIRELKSEGKRAMNHIDFWAGNQNILGKKFL